MIKPTDEMVSVVLAETELGDRNDTEPQIRRALAAVLAIVERDYRVQPLCLEESGVPGTRCTKLRNHVPLHYAPLPFGSGMSW